MKKDVLILLGIEGMLALSIVGVLVLNSSLVSASPTTTILDYTFDLADILGIDEASTWYAQVQVKWNISSIPASSDVTDATLCLYWKIKTGSPDNDVNITRVTNQTWIETPTAAGYNAMVLTNSSLSTWNSTTASTYGCVNVTDIIEMDYLSGNKNSTIRIKDPDAFAAPSVIYDVVVDELLMIGDVDVADLRGEDRENSGATGFMPKLYISYESLAPPPTSCASYVSATKEWYVPKGCQCYCDSPTIGFLNLSKCSCIAV